MTELLGREPLGPFAVVVRRPDGTPAVIENAPLQRDGRPMPTRFWLVDPELRARVARLESAGGVREAERRWKKRTWPTAIVATQRSATR